MPFALRHPYQFKKSLEEARKKEGRDQFFIASDGRIVEMSALRRMMEETREWNEPYFLTTGWTWLFSFVPILTGSRF